MTLAVANTNATEVAGRMAKTCSERERRDSLYFDAEGKLIPMTGWKFGHGEGGGRATGLPGNAVYAVDHPFRPSLASCGDMVGEHLLTGRLVIYDEERWEADPRILEQAGPSITGDWKIEELLGRVAA